GLSLDLSGMNKIGELNEGDMDVTVEAGVTRLQLNHHLHNTGLFFPVDPGADASLGGMAATRASGTNAVRYGTMRDNVLNLTAVLADGSIVKTGGRARKSSTGYDLTRLLIGSEGTLGVICELTLKLHALPETTSAAVVSFPELEGAVKAVMTTIQSAIPISRIELLDEVQVGAVNSYSGLDYSEQPTLFLEFQGSESAVAEQVKIVGEICSDNGGGDFRWASKQEDRNALWKARHDVAYANMAMRPGAKPWFTDVCVPISRLAENILEARKDIDASGLTAPIVGHVGDGNFHTTILIDEDNTGEMDRAREFNDRMVKRAIASGGTCSGEHGVGIGKKEFMELEYGTGVAVMKTIKRALDPDNILNPGKIVDT
ncbi:MAG: FAD-binding protein, partial [Rhodospirillaceae bacterium]|nr:FAD-binding protein [Rhodospirillaceae bacterium]